MHLRDMTILKLTARIIIAGATFAAAYLAFRTECAAQYEALDAVCEGLTVQEISLGHLEQLKP